MRSIVAAAADLQNFCQEQRWQFCFIGGLAAQRWAEPRFTHDADMTLLTGIGREEDYVEKLLEKYPRAKWASANSLSGIALSGCSRRTTSPWTLH